jgi:hypothetical protein
MPRPVFAMSDDGKRKKGRRSDVPWPAIRAAYESGETQFVALGRKFDVSRNLIATRAKKEKWAVNAHVSEQIADKARSNIIDMATRRTLEKLGGAEAIEAKADAVARELQVQSKLSGKLLDAADSVLDKFLAGGVQPGDKQNEADVLNSLANAVSKAFDAARTIHGLTAGKPSVSSTEAVDAPADQVVLIVRERKESA